MNRFTAEELAAAKSADLTAVATSLGYTVRQAGRYHTIKEMDSVRIYDRATWFRWSKQYDKGENGGSQIDFLRVFAGMNVKEAVFWLLDFIGYKRMEDKNRPMSVVPLAVQKGEMVQGAKSLLLPSPATDHQYLLHYLHGKRGISKGVIQYLLDQNLIYEANRYHNIVFQGKDKDGNIRFASMRGVFDRGGYRFKCDVAGSDKNYGFNIVSNGELLKQQTAS